MFGHAIRSANERASEDIATRTPQSTPPFSFFRTLSLLRLVTLLHLLCVFYRRSFVRRRNIRGPNKSHQK